MYDYNLKKKDFIILFLLNISNQFVPKEPIPYQEKNINFLNSNV